MDKLIKANGNIIEIVPSNGNKYTLSELQKYVGGYIELVNSTDGDIIVCNEEAKIINLPVNAKASYLYANSLYSDDYFAGDIVVINPKHID